MRRFSHDSKGAAAVEFAIISVCFITLLLGILSYGIYFAVAHSVQQIAAESARAAIAGLSDEERLTLASGRAVALVDSYPILVPENMTVTAAASASDPELFEVTVRYDARHLGLGAMAALLPTPPEDIARTSTIRRGGW